MSSSIITTNLVGGLGNQLFLVANLLATAQRHHMIPYLPLLPVSSSCEAPRPTYWSSIFQRLHSDFGVLSELPDDAVSSVVPWRTIPESRPLRPIPRPSLHEEARRCYYQLVGFFQAEVMFSDFPIVKDVVPLQLHEQAMRALQSGYQQHGEEHLIGMHIRRGDYTRMTDTFSFLRIEEYYDRALQQLLGSNLFTTAARQKRHHLVLFCEDEREGAAARAFFQSKYTSLPVSHVTQKGTEAALQYRGHGEPGLSSQDCPQEVLELLMLAHCDDVVMANSTFSWWGAYLNESPGLRVVAPSEWYTKGSFSSYAHLYRDQWLVL